MSWWRGLWVLVVLAPLVPVASGGPVSCEPSAWPEGVELRGVAQRVAVGEETFYVVTRGASTIGQSDVEVWEETNGLPGLQAWEGECGRPSDRFLARACVFRTGVVGALPCPALAVGDAAGFVMDRVALP